MIYKDLFHIHTKRCNHAGNDSDESYILKAIELESKSLYFTDHAPFPDNVFGNRMSMDELDEYLSSLTILKDKYKNVIDIKIGLEIEYIPKFKPYYEWLKNSCDIELFLGQHICFQNGIYNFQCSNKHEEYKWMTESIMEALDTNMFAVLLHPERIYRNCDKWDNEQKQAAIDIWNYTKSKNIPIEYNCSSIVNPQISFWHSKFWEFANHNNIIYGLDAHSVKDLEIGTKYFRDNSSINIMNSTVK